MCNYLGVSKPVTVQLVGNKLVGRGKNIFHVTPNALLDLCILRPSLAVVLTEVTFYVAAHNCIYSYKVVQI